MRDAALSAAAIAIVGLSATAFSVFYGRRAGAVGLGHAALALAVGTGVPQVACAGLVGGITRFVAARRGAGDQAGTARALARGLGACAILGLGLGGAALATAPAWAPRVGLPAGLVAPAAALVVLECLYFGLKASLYGLALVAGYARLELAGGAVFAALLAALLAGAPVTPIAPFLAADAAMVGLGAATLWRGRALWLPSAGEPGRSATADPGPTESPTRGMDGRTGAHGVPAEAPVRGHAPARPAERPDDGSMTRWVAVAYLGTAASLARLRLPVLVAGAALAAADAGRLQAAFAFFAPLMLVPRALELALLPWLARAHAVADRAALRARTEGATAAVAAGMAVLGGALLLGAEAVLVALFGPSFAPAAPALWAVVAGAWLVGLASPSVVALSGADGVAVVSAAGVAGLVASAAVWMAAVPALGATGAALGFAAGSAVAAGWPLLAARRRYGVASRAAWTISLRAAALLIVGWVALRALGPADAGRARWFVQAAVAIAYAVGAAAATRGPLAALLRSRPGGAGHAA